MDWVIRFPMVNTDRRHLMVKCDNLPFVFVYGMVPNAEATRFHSYTAAWNACDEYNCRRSALEPYGEVVGRVRAGSGESVTGISERLLKAISNASECAKRFELLASVVA